MLAAMTDQPIACTLPVTHVPGRIALIGSLAADALLDRRSIAGGVRWRFRDAPEVERRVHDVVALESECCAFLRFEVHRDDAIVLDITGPAEALPVIEQFFTGR
jgi:hypothetical protein